MSAPEAARLPCHTPCHVPCHIPTFDEKMQSIIGPLGDDRLVRVTIHSKVVVQGRPYAFRTQTNTVWRKLNGFLTRGALRSKRLPFISSDMFCFQGDKPTAQLQFNQPDARDYEFDGLPLTPPTDFPPAYVERVGMNAACDLVYSSDFVELDFSNAPTLELVLDWGKTSMENSEPWTKERRRLHAKTKREKEQPSEGSKRRRAK